MYKYSVIGDNTQENREWLEKVGVEHNPFDDKLNSNPHLISNFGMYISIDATSLIELNMMNEAYEDDINCIGNSPLFKAVSAMREDSDFGQLFECKDGLLICQYPTSREHINKECKGWDVTGLKKYTLTELQERFKEKER